MDLMLFPTSYEMDRLTAEQELQAELDAAWWDEHDWLLELPEAQAERDPEAVSCI